jgi:hypothetical protein
MILQFIDGLGGDAQVTFEEGTRAAWLYDLRTVGRSRVCSREMKIFAKLDNDVEVPGGGIQQNLRTPKPASSQSGLVLPNAQLLFEEDAVAFMADLAGDA